MILSEKGIFIRETVEPDLRQIYLCGKDEPVFKNIAFKMTPEILAEIYNSSSSITYSAVRKKKVLGFIIGSVDGSISKIHWLMVKPEFRKTGIGKELLKSYIEKSGRSGSEQILVSVSDLNNEALKFFTAGGLKAEETIFQLYRKI